MASKKISTPVVVAFVKVAVPNTKKLGSQETLRDKTVRRYLRAYNWAGENVGGPREAEFAKKLAGCASRLSLVSGNPVAWTDLPLDAFATKAMELAGLVVVAKPVKAPARKKAAAKPKVAAPATVETPAEEATAE